MSRYTRFALPMGGGGNDHDDDNNNGSAAVDVP
jgi:hypothetical protein